MVERVLQPGEDGVAAVRREVAEGEAEGGGGVVAVLPVRLRHRQFVEVGESARLGWDILTLTLALSLEGEGNRA